MIEGSPDIAASWWLRLKHAGAAAALLLGACSVGESEAYPLPENSPICSPALADQPQSAAEEAARRCIDVMQSGRLALVTFDMPQESAQTIADDASQIMQEATEGRIQMDVEALPASPQAQEVVEDINGEAGCVDSGGWTSVIADEVMQLGDYDQVISMSNLPACDESIDGIATLGGRYGEVFMPGEMSVQRAVAVFLHEWGHLYGFLHEGTAQQQLGGYVGADINPREVFDLAAHLANARYVEYSPLELMGSGGTTPVISDVNLARLRWTEEVLTGETVVYEMGAEPVTLTVDDVRNRGFARLDLDEPATATYEREGEPYQVTFDNLIVTPTALLFAYPEDGIIGGKLILENSQGHGTVTIGNFDDSYESEAAWPIKLDDSTNLVINIEDGDMTLQVAPSTES